LDAAILAPGKVQGQFFDKANKWHQLQNQQFQVNHPIFAISAQNNAQSR